VSVCVNCMQVYSSTTDLISNGAGQITDELFAIQII